MLKSIFSKAGKGNNQSIEAPSPQKKEKTTELKPTNYKIFTKQPHITNAALQRLEEIQKRLFDIGQELRSVQPKAPGAITLTIKGCGKDCLGCPHLSFVKWYSGPLKGDNSGDRHFNSTELKNPLLAIPKKKQFEDCYTEVYALIKEALKLKKEKAKLIAIYSRLNRILKVY